MAEVEGRKGQSGLSSFLRMAEQNKEMIITGSLLLYVGVYLVVGLGGVGFQLQPALGYLQTQSNSNAPAGALWVEGTDLHWADGSTEYFLNKSANLVGDYHMDEGSGQTVGDSHSPDGANDGTLGASTSSESSDPSWVAGRFDDALDFDGSDDYVGGISNINSQISKITVSAWVNPDSFSTSNYQGIVTEEYNTENVDVKFELFYDGSVDKYAAGFYDGSWHKVFDANTDTRTGTWIHLTATYDGSTLELYKDGSLVNSVSDSTGLPSGDNPWRIGTRHDGWGDAANFFDGQIDEVRIYNRDLNQWEIKQLYRGDSTNPGGGSSGALWIEGSDIHWIDANGYEQLYNGSLVTTSPGGSNGAAWIESGNLHYIDANGDERVADR